MPLATSGPKSVRDEDDLVCEFLDISRAHFHAPIERLIFVSVDGMVHKRGRTTCGLQDACGASDRMSSSVAETLGCKLGTITHCVLTRGNLAQRYGDDQCWLRDVRCVSFVRTRRSTSCSSRAQVFVDSTACKGIAAL